MKDTTVATIVEFGAFGLFMYLAHLAIRLVSL